MSDSDSRIIRVNEAGPSVIVHLSCSAGGAFEVSKDDGLFKVQKLGNLKTWHHVAAVPRGDETAFEWATDAGLLALYQLVKAHLTEIVDECKERGLLSLDALGNPQMTSGAGPTPGAKA